MMSFRALLHTTVVLIRFGGGGGTFLHSRVQFGMTALMWAASNGHADCARLLLDAGADKEAKNEVRDPAPSAVGLRCGMVVLNDCCLRKPLM